MGKRSGFERIEKDFYRTIDPRAVAALSLHLEPDTIFAEPCAGEGDLIRDLERIGLQCDWQTDLPIDARSITCDDLASCDLIITNPPWSRPILHELILHLSSLKPTWLLFDADWAHTRQSAPLMKHCRAIVSVGRLLWIPGTTMSGKDNCAWYLFDQKTVGAPIFHGRF